MIDRFESDFQDLSSLRPPSEISSRGRPQPQETPGRDTSIDLSKERFGRLSSSALPVRTTEGELPQLNNPTENSLILEASVGKSRLPLISRIENPHPSRFGHTKPTLAVSLDALFAVKPGLAHQILAQYYPRYAAAFPDQDERLTLPQLVDLISNPSNTWDISVIRHRGQIVGGYHTLLAPLGEQLASLGDYLWVSPGERGTGLARRIYEHVIELRRQVGAVAHFGEVNDPHVMPPEKRQLDEQAGSSPDARIRFWSKLGRLACDAPWLQPALATECEEVNYLMLTVHPLDPNLPTSLTREQYLSIWDGFYQPLAGQIDLAKTRKRLEELLKDQPEIHFIPLEQRRSHLK